MFFVWGPRQRQDATGVSPVNTFWNKWIDLEFYLEKIIFHVLLYHSLLCSVTKRCCDIFRHCVSLFFTGTVKVILNTCLWTTAPDDCQLTPTLSIWPFDSHKHMQARAHTRTHTLSESHRLLACGFNRLNPGFPNIDLFICVTQLKIILLVIGPTMCAE